MTIFHVIRNFVSSTVVIPDYQFQGSISFFIANELEKEMRKINSSSQEQNFHIHYFLHGRDFSFMFCPYFYFICSSHARLSILRLGRCLCRNFFYDIQDILRGTHPGTIRKCKCYFLEPRSHLEAISIPL